MSRRAKLWVVAISLAALIASSILLSGDGAQDQVGTLEGREADAGFVEPSTGQLSSPAAPGTRTSFAAIDSTEGAESDVIDTTTGPPPVRITVLDERGGPIEGATLYFEELGDDGERVTTDRHGVAVLSRGTHTGTLTVHGEAKGRYEAHRPVRPLIGSAELTLPARSELSWKLLDAETNEPVAGARFVLWMPALSPGASVCESDEAGIAGSVSAPAEFVSALDVRAKGYLSVYERHLPPAADTTEQRDVRLVPSAPIVLRLVDRESGRPIGTGSAQSFGAGTSGRKFTVRADIAGSCELTDVAPRDYEGEAHDHEIRILATAFPYCSVSVIVNEETLGDSRVIVVPMVRHNSVTLRASSSDGGSLEGSRVVVAFHTLQVGHGRRPYDRDAYDWPSNQIWWNHARSLEFTLDLGVNGRAVIHNLPPGTLGLDIWSDEEPRRLLAEVAGFTGTGEARTVYVTL